MLGIGIFDIPPAECIRLVQINSERFFRPKNLLIPCLGTCCEKYILMIDD